MYAVAWYHLVNLFSHRAPTANAFAARTLPCPSPAGIKLALLSRLIERDGVNRAQEHLEWLAPLRIAWASPAMLAITAATMTVLKDDRGKTPLMRSVGFREYVHFDEPFGLALGPVAGDRQDDLEQALTRLRALGIAESLVQPLALPTWQETIPPGFTWLTESTTTSTADEYPPASARASEVVVLDDLGTAPRFERLSVYRPNEREFVPRLGEDRRRMVVVLPLRQHSTRVSGRVLARITARPVDEEDTPDATDSRS